MLLYFMVQNVFRYLEPDRHGSRVLEMDRQIEWPLAVVQSNDAIAKGRSICLSDL